MLWFGAVTLEKGNAISRDIYGPFDDIDSMAPSIAEVIDEARSDGYRAVILPFELCSDDVPEVIGINS